MAGSDLSEKEVLSRRMLDRLKNEISSETARVFHFPWLKMAAILFLFIGVATILVYVLKPGTNAYITVKNPSGKIQLVNLPDKSQVWLNASTTISYRKSFKENRDLKLEGEAYFKVTHDPKHPFTVDAGGLQTTVLGTSFNIKAFKSGITTTVSVISGKVKVTDSSKELGILLPSYQLQFDRNKQLANTLPIDTNHVLAWKNGKLEFDGETFADIAVVLESWYDTRIIFAEPGIMNCRYYMSVKNTISLDSLLKLLSGVTEIKYVFNKDRTTVTIYGDDCR